MPKAPDWIDKVNYIVDFWVDPCHAPVLVYLELALPPAGDAILAWFSFGLSDVLRGYLRPSKALGGTSFKRRGKEKKPKTRFWKAVEGSAERLRTVPGFGDDVGNWIGKNLPGAEEVKGRSIGQGERFLWMIDDLGQRALLALLIADIAIDFLYEWATLVAETEYCKRTWHDSLYATGPGVSTGFPFVCWPATGAVIVFKEGSVDWLGNTGGSGSGLHNVVSAMALRNIGLTPCQHWQRFTITDDQGFRQEALATQTIGPGQSASSVARATLVGASTFTVDSCALGGSVTADTHDLSIWGGSHQP